MAAFSEYHQYDGLGLADLVRRRQVTPGELIEAAVERIEKHNPRLNAVIHKMYEAAMEAAAGGVSDGPFAGVPFLLKDLGAAYAGEPLCNGSRFYRGFVPDHDSELVKRFKAAGVIVVGKTNTPEYGLAPVTEPALFGPTNNPWDPSRTPGGSSGGSAAAVAAAMVPIAHGNDGGGSIRIPASCCGLFGLKPTRGRNPLGPDLSEAWHGFVADHVLTRSVRDSAAMLDATAGPEVGAPYYAPAPQRAFLDQVSSEPGRLRIAYTPEPPLPTKVHVDCVRGLEDVVELCRELGHEVVEAAPPVDGKAFARAFITMVCGETRADIEEGGTMIGRRPTFKDLEPATWTLSLLGKGVGSARYAAAVRLLQRTARQVGSFFEQYDALLTPTLASPPVVTGALRPKGTQALAMKVSCRLKAEKLLQAFAGIEKLADQAFAFAPYTPVFNATGQPAMSVPLYWNEKGLPIGMHFVGRYGDEATLFRLAGQLEKARPWFGRVPPEVWPENADPAHACRAFTQRPFLEDSIAENIMAKLLMLS